MIFTETRLKGAFLIQPELLEDERGFFACTWSQREFAERGLNSNPAQGNISFNKKKGTVRGMHYQAAPHGQAKLVRCTKGSIYDVIIDLRSSSATFKEWLGVELTASNHLMLYLPEDFAHGYQTLEDETEIVYQVSSRYAPESGRGIRWNDPAFGISWPLTETIINERDRTYPNF